jgi:hypothetical protein
MTTTSIKMSSIKNNNLTHMKVKKTVTFGSVDIRFIPARIVMSEITERNMLKFNSDSISRIPARRVRLVNPDNKIVPINENIENENEIGMEETMLIIAFKRAQMGSWMSQFS